MRVNRKTRFKHPKTITCICGTITKVAMNKRTCGNKQCAREWRLITEFKINNILIMRRQLNPYF